MSATAARDVATLTLFVGKTTRADGREVIGCGAYRVVSGQMRRRLPWLIALPLMAAGSFAAHALSYVVAGTRAEGGADGDIHGASERTSAGIAAHSVLPVGLLVAFGIGAGTAWLVGRARGKRGAGASPWLFFALPPLAFSVQELIERLVNAEAAPFQAALEPRFLIGLALQVPLGLIALFVARALLRVVRRIARALVRQRSVVLSRRAPVLRLPLACELPRIPALALGYPQRGPPRL